MPRDVVDLLDALLRQQRRRRAEEPPGTREAGKARKLHLLHAGLINLQRGRVENDKSRRLTVCNGKM